MKVGKAKIGIFQKMRIKNLRGSVRSDFKNDSLETSKNHLIRNFLRNGLVRVKTVLGITSKGVLLQKFEGVVYDGLKDQIIHYEDFLNLLVSIRRFFKNSYYSIIYIFSILCVIRTQTTSLIILCYGIVECFEFS